MLSELFLESFIIKMYCFSQFLCYYIYYCDISPLSLPLLLSPTLCDISMSFFYYHSLSSSSSILHLFSLKSSVTLPFCLDFCLFRFLFPLLFNYLPYYCVIFTFYFYTRSNHRNLFLIYFSVNLALLTDPLLSSFHVLSPLITTVIHFNILISTNSILFS